MLHITNSVFLHNVILCATKKWYIITPINKFYTLRGSNKETFLGLIFKEYIVQDVFKFLENIFYKLQGFKNDLFSVCNISCNCERQVYVEVLKAFRSISTKTIGSKGWEIISMLCARNSQSIKMSSCVLKVFH